MNVFIKWYLIFLFILILPGCASQSKIDNIELTDDSPENPYSYKLNLKKRGEISFFVSFSGGGTRSATATLGEMRERYERDGADSDALDQLDFYITAMTQWHEKLEELRDDFL